MRQGDKKETIRDFLESESNNNNYTSVPLDEKGEITLETDEERRERKISLWIIYLTVFVQSLGASVVITGIWPYLNSLDNAVSKEWLGAIVAANPLGQLIFSPVIGWLCNKISSVRIPSIICLVVFILSNFWYALLPLHKGHVKYYMFCSRLLVGVSSGSIAVCRTFITQGTLISERTTSISYLSLFQALGFILGPAAQVALTLMIGKETKVILGFLPISMYSACGWVGAIFGLINLGFYFSKLFQESNVAEREAQVKLQDEQKLIQQKQIDWSKVPLDLIAVMSILIAFFIVFFNFSLLEVLGTPVTTEQLGWSHEEATLKMGFATILSSILSLACFFTIPLLCKRFDERKILLGLGMLPMVLGRFLFFPMGGSPAPMRIEKCVWKSVQLHEFTNKSSCESIGDGAQWLIVQHGCPQEQSWCLSTSALNGIAMAVGYAVVTVGYPYSVVLLQTVFSKVIGPRPQGTWMGALTAITSLARVVGPIWVAWVYAKHGTIWTSLSATVLMLLALILLTLVYRRLVPMKIPKS